MFLHLLIALSLQATTPDAPAPEPETPVPAEEAQPPSEAEIAAFVAALPPAGEEAGDSRAQQMAGEELRKKNPGRSFDLEPIIAAYGQCNRTAVNEVAMNSVRESARRMGAEKLALLTAFYKSKDFARFSTLIEREEKGMPLGAPETAELEAMFARYPLQEFAKVSEQLAREMFTDKSVLDRFDKCLSDRDTALQAAGLKP